MAATKISDVIVPDVFNPYMQERTKELTKLYLSGIITSNDELDLLAVAGGKLINMPFWQDLTGNDEVLTDSAALTPGNVSSEKDVATLLMRGRAWGANDLAKSLSGSDPMRSIADGVAVYWARRRQQTLIQSLNGVFASNVANESGDMVVDVANESAAAATAQQKIGPDTVIDAVQTLGDASFDIVAIAMHSAVFGSLQKQEVIVYEKAAGTDIKLPTYLGLRVFVDDGMPTEAGATDGTKYTSYLFGEGAIGLGDGQAPVPSETDRDSLAGEDYLITRSHYILHPRGVAFTAASVAGESATNAELATAANWSRKYTRKNVRLAKLVTNI